jgi:hypothetical protein
MLNNIIYLNIVLLAIIIIIKLAYLDLGIINFTYKITIVEFINNINGEIDTIDIISYLLYSIFI